MSTNRQSRFLWLLLIVGLLIGPVFSYGQSIYRNAYKRSPAISDQAGKPQNAQTLYFPAERFIDSSEVLVRVPKNRITDTMRKSYPGTDSLFLESQIQAQPETFKLNWFSYYLYNLQEPVLYNYPLHKEVYRLTWLRSFHPPVVVSLEKRGDDIQLRTKMLVQNPKLPGIRYSDQRGNIQVADTAVGMPFQINTVKTGSKADYAHYVKLLDSLNAVSISPLGLSVVGTDGSRWILEMHRPDGYYFFTRFMPSANEPIRLLGDYLLNLSDAKNERRY